MSKDNREMEDISGKFRKWLLEKDKWGLPRRRTDMCSDTLEIGFFYGYTIAQKEMQEKLDEAIEVIKFYANPESYNMGSFPHGFAGIFNDIENDHSRVKEQKTLDGRENLSSYGGKRARDFLKASELDWIKSEKEE